jgi:adenylosuccinate synthase
MNKLSIFYGAQWGSEGKGNFASAIATDSIDQFDQVVALRVGSINAGHTVTDVTGDQYCTQLVPGACFTNPSQVDCILGAACLVCFDTLYKELTDLEAMCQQAGAEEPTYYIDEQMGVVTERHHEIENEVNLEERIGSTKEGVGAATADRVMRDAPRALEYFNNVYSQEQPERYRYLREKLVFCDTVGLIADMATDQTQSSHLILEGTQGALLSLYTSGFYPFTTSRQCDPYSMMGQAGTNDRVWDECDVIAVCRTFPIRVGGNSGDLPGEVTWDHMREVTDGYIVEPETTSVTGRSRRIATLDMDYLREKSFVPHMPDVAAISFMDYINPEDAYVKEWDELSDAALDFVREFEETTGVAVRFVSTQAGSAHVIRNPEPGRYVSEEPVLV